MVEVMYTFYEYKEDHRLNDTISGLANIGISLGEVIGPIYITLMQRFYSLRIGYTVFALLLLLYSIFYFIVQNTIKRSDEPKKNCETALVELNS